MADAGSSREPRSGGSARTTRGSQPHGHFPHDGVEPEFTSVEESFESFIRTKGLKLTSQRRRILKRVFQIHHHFTAEDLYEQFQRGGDRISRATIYRTLSLLLEGGFLDCLDFGQDRKYYEHVLGHHRHDHLVCLACEKVREFVDPRIEALERELADKFGFQIRSHSLRIFGYCAECKEKVVGLPQRPLAR